MPSIFFEDEKAKEETSYLLYKYLDVVQEEKVPTRKIKTIKEAPIIWRYFAKPKEEYLEDEEIDEDQSPLIKVIC